jgi:beta-1,2-mannobiose phosphorylase / 1,2-beta-oligomannan phosphorylase
MVIKIQKEEVLLTVKDFKPTSRKFMILGVLNPGVVRLPDGKVMMFARVIERLIKYEDEKYCYSPRMVGKDNFKIKIDKFSKDIIDESSDTGFIFKDGTKRLTYYSYFARVILSKSGFKILSIDKKPSFYGLSDDGELGVEDPRISKIKDMYVMTYVSLSREQNISTSMAVSYDTINWERKGIIFGEQDKDVVLFPETINGKYVAFDRPEGNFQFSQPHIWIAYSENLTSWGGLKPIECVYEEHGFCPRNGAGPPPIKTEKGWLLLYHAVTEFKEEEQEKEIINKLKKIVKLKSDVIKKISELNIDMIKKTTLYSVGGALFDLNEPEKLIGKSTSFLIVPDSKHDSSGFENKRVTFPTGLIYDANGKDLIIYSGGADVLITARKVNLSEILESLKKVKC